MFDSVIRKYLISIFDMVLLNIIELIIVGRVVLNTRLKLNLIELTGFTIYCINSYLHFLLKRPKNESAPRSIVPNFASISVTYLGELPGRVEPKHTTETIALSRCGMQKQETFSESILRRLTTYCMRLAVSAKDGSPHLPSGPFGFVQSSISIKLSINPLNYPYANPTKKYLQKL